MNEWVTLPVDRFMITLSVGASRPPDAADSGIRGTPGKTLKTHAAAGRKVSRGVGRAQVRPGDVGKVRGQILRIVPPRRPHAGGA